MKNKTGVSVKFCPVVREHHQSHQFTITCACVSLSLQIDAIGKSQFTALLHQSQQIKYHPGASVRHNEKL